MLQDFKTRWLSLWGVFHSVRVFIVLSFAEDIPSVLNNSHHQLPRILQGYVATFFRSASDDILENRVKFYLYITACYNILQVVCMMLVIYFSLSHVADEKACIHRMQNSM